ncbi:NAD-binding protein [Mycolicibacterium sp.]|uniref:NAD-binding protein n=1 Tax=Mycolicibacterium sp. TaxID=2320850 RepID=UPI00341DED7F
MPRSACCTLQSPAGLAAAEIKTARAVICASGDDSLNLETALLARRANPHVRVVARFANSMLRQAMNNDEGPGAVLDIADLAAPSVAEALLGRTEHAIPVSAVNFVVSSAAAPRDGTLREIDGLLAPVTIIRGADSPVPGEVIACPQLDVAVRESDWITMIGRTEVLAEQGLGVVRQDEPAPSRRSPLSRAVDAVRAFRDDINPTFYRALAVLVTLLFSATLILRFCFQNPATNWMDALYLSTETLATVGYDDFNFMHQSLRLRGCGWPPTRFRACAIHRRSGHAVVHRDCYGFGGTRYVSSGPALLHGRRGTGASRQRIGRNASTPRHPPACR